MGQSAKSQTTSGLDLEKGFILQTQLTDRKENLKNET